MRTVYFIFCLICIVACNDPNAKRPVFLWSYTTKSELQAKGLKPTSVQLSSNTDRLNVVDDWLVAGFKDTTISYFFYDDTLLLFRKITVQNVADSNKLFTYLKQLGFERNLDKLALKDSSIQFEISRDNKDFNFIQDYNRDTARLVFPADSVSMKKN